MRFWGILLVAVSLVYFGLVRISPLQKLAGKSFHDIETDYSLTQSRLERYEHSASLPEGGGGELIEMRENQKLRSLQMFRIRYSVDETLTWTMILGAFLLLSAFLSSFLGRKKLEKIMRPKTDLMEQDASVREEYLDDWEFNRKMEDGFSSREEAIHWINQDPLLKCDYCGGKLRSTFTGDREGLEFVTYYKKVPPGAKDMRIILGSRWYGKAATELKCSGCDRIVHR